MSEMHKLVSCPCLNRQRPSGVWRPRVDNMLETPTRDKLWNSTNNKQNANKIFM